MTYIVIEVDGILRRPINYKGEPDRYTKPKMFQNKKAAQAWIDKRTYKGMSWHYEIKEYSNESL